MKVLIIGGGGREHALAWKVAASPRVRRVFVAPGNAGTAAETGCENVPIAAGAIEELLGFAREGAIDLTIVGPEAPLVAGVVDAFRNAGLAIFGPGAAAARLEGSKSFAKDFLARHGIPTAAYRTFTRIDDAEAYIRERGAPVVVKADGLASGKGVVVAADAITALTAARDMLAGNAFGTAGHRVVIEDFLAGEEASFIVMVDGEHVLPMASSQDHKRRDDGDRGPNTGGMGACSPAPVVTPEVHARIMERVILPTVRGMAADGTPYHGFLYAGLMITADGEPQVVEFNCRFGDPETQPVLMRLRSDLVELVQAALAGRLDTVQADWDSRPALGVVVAAAGYPQDPRIGDAIYGLDSRFEPDIKVFHAGTAIDHGHVVTAGGRVLCATALGETIARARQRAYGAVDRIRGEGLFHRTDIGWRALGPRGA